jgi:integrase
VIDDYKICNIKNKHFIGFLRLKYSSQLNYRRALDIIKRKAGYYQMIDVTQEGIRGFRNELIKENCATSQIDQCLMVWSVLWMFAAEFCDLPLGPNPTTGIMRVHGEHNAHKRRPMQVIEAFYTKANRVMRLALYLLLYTGQREIDVIAMKWTDVQRRGDVDMIFIKQQKTDTKVWIPIHPKLAELLEKTPRINDYILNTNRREPFASTSSIPTPSNRRCANVGLITGETTAGTGYAPQPPANCWKPDAMKVWLRQSPAIKTSGCCAGTLRKPTKQINRPVARVWPKNKSPVPKSKSANPVRKPR